MSLARSPFVVAFGECMVELRQVEPGLMRQSFGGDTLNTALYLARLAGSAYSVGYATALGGNDPYSHEMAAAWQAENIDTRLVARMPGEMPGLYSIQVDAQGERHFSYWRQNAPVRRYFSAPERSLLEAQQDGVDLLYLSGISLAILPQAGRERLLALMQAIRQRGGQVVFDNNYRPRLWNSADEARAIYARAYALASTALITLDDEMAVLNSYDAAAALEHIGRYGCAETIIKRGQQPTLVCVDGAVPVEVKTTVVDKVVDTTAAGDSFAAGYVAGRLHGLAPAAAAAAGNRLAGLVIQHPGAIIPSELMPGNLFA